MEVSKWGHVWYYADETKRLTALQAFPFSPGRELRNEFWPGRRETLGSAVLLAGLAYPSGHAAPGVNRSRWAFSNNEQTGNFHSADLPNNESEARSVRTV
jgi:hypothetical protein